MIVAIVIVVIMIVVIMILILVGQIITTCLGCRGL